mmetsp:Transcript_7236/g.6418  ORF Transcript_7236/g.6418 Transcript_7236/m.6418 type:complete len:334 (-) Transcript_7236:322-1323(-)
MESTSKYTIGLLKETATSWESRVALTPKSVSYFTSQNIRVIVEKSNYRCYDDKEFEEAGAELVDRITESDSKTILLGIKPIQPSQIIPDTNYMFYSRIANNLGATLPLRQALIDKNCSFIDYEVIRDKEGKSLVGTSKLAGIVGAFNTIRALGEFLLIKGAPQSGEERKKIRTPFLQAGSAYMYESYNECVQKLHQIRDSLKSKPDRIAANCGPIIAGILGMGTVGQGAKEIFIELGAEEITSDQLTKIDELDSSKLYYVALGRKHFLQRDGKEEFNEEDYQENKDKYETVFHNKYLPKLSVLINCIGWSPDCPKLLTSDQMNQVLDNSGNRL